MECLLITLLSKKRMENAAYTKYQIPAKGLSWIQHTCTIGNLAMKCNEVDPEYLSLIRLD